MKRINYFKIIALALTFVFALSFSLPREALAYRTDSGGGETQEFSIGKFALGTAIGMASSFAGSALSSGSGLGSLVGNTSSFSMGSAFTSWGTGYASNLGTGQLQRAMYAMGNYYGWSGQSKMLAGTMASSLGSGLISAAGGGGLSGLGSGVAEGVVKGGILMAGSNSKGEYDPWVGFAAGVAGDFAGGAVSGGGIGNLIQSIPSNLISVAQSSATEGKDMMDRYIINQAFTGAHAAAGGLSSSFTNKVLGLSTGYSYDAAGNKIYRSSSKGTSGTGSGVGNSVGDTNATADLSGSTLPLDSNLGTMTTAFPDTVDYPVGFNPVTGYQPDTTAYNVPSAPTLVDSSVNSVTPITLVSAESTPYNLTLASTPSSVTLLDSYINNLSVTEYPWGFESSVQPSVNFADMGATPGLPGANATDTSPVTDWSIMNAKAGAPGEIQDIVSEKPALLTSVSGSQIDVPAIVTEVPSSYIIPPYQGAKNTMANLTIPDLPVTKYGQYSTTPGETAKDLDETPVDITFPDTGETPSLVSVPLTPVSIPEMAQYQQGDYQVPTLAGDAWKNYSPTLPPLEDNRVTTATEMPEFAQPLPDEYVAKLSDGVETPYGFGGIDTVVQPVAGQSAATMPGFVDSLSEEVIYSDRQGNIKTVPLADIASRPYVSDSSKAAIVDLGGGKALLPDGGIVPKEIIPRMTDYADAPVTMSAEAVAELPKITTIADLAEKGLVPTDAVRVGYKGTEVASYVTKDGSLYGRNASGQFVQIQPLEEGSGDISASGKVVVGDDWIARLPNGVTISVDQIPALSNTVFGDLPVVKNITVDTNNPGAKPNPNLIKTLEIPLKNNR